MPEELPKPWRFAQSKHSPVLVFARRRKFVAIEHGGEIVGAFLEERSGIGKCLVVNRRSEFGEDEIEQQAGLEIADGTVSKSLREQSTLGTLGTLGLHVSRKRVTTAGPERQPGTSLRCHP